MTELERAVAFHGHLCPMFYLGFRMGELALQSLARGREQGVKLHVVVEFANCFGDGIQFVTGATFGKNNLHLDDKGKFAASFYDLAGGRSLRLRMRNDVVEKVLGYGRAGNEVKKLPPGQREEEARRLMAKGRRMVEWLKSLGDEELFEETPAPAFTPENAIELEHVVCSRCRELALKRYALFKGSETLCLHCSSS